MIKTTSEDGTIFYDFGRVCSELPITEQSWWTQVSNYLSDQQGFLLLEETIEKPSIAYLDKIGNPTLWGSARSVACMTSHPYLTTHSTNKLSLGVPEFVQQREHDSIKNIAEGLDGILQNHRP